MKMKVENLTKGVLCVGGKSIASGESKVFDQGEWAKVKGQAEGLKKVGWVKLSEAKGKASQDPPVETEEQKEARLAKEAEEKAAAEAKEKEEAEAKKKAEEAKAAKEKEEADKKAKADADKKAAADSKKKAGQGRRRAAKK